VQRTSVQTISDAFNQLLHCITPLFAVLADSAAKRMCLQLFGAIACAVRATAASDGKLRLCVPVERKSARAANLIGTCVLEPCV
jgi:hypothetical protein